MKQIYQTPSVSVIGSFEEVTLGSTTGTQLDAPIPTGTPVSQIPGFVANHLQNS